MHAKPPPQNPRGQWLPRVRRTSISAPCVHCVQCCPFETKATGARDPVAEHTHDRQPFPASCTKHPVTGPYARTHTHAHTHTHTYHHHHHHHHLGECTGSFPLCFNPFCSMKMLFALTGAAGERQFGFHVCWSREKWATKPARVDLVTPSLPVKHGREPHPSIVV